MKRILSPASILVLLALASGCQLFPASVPRNAPGAPRSSGTGFPASPLAPTPIPTEQVPDASAWIAFVRDNNIWLIHPDGNALTPITHFRPAVQPEDRRIRELKWSPDGKRLAFSYGARGIFSIQLVDVESFRAGMLLPETGGYFDWSASGRELIYDTAVYRSSASGKNRGLWVIKLGDRTRKQVFQSAADQPSPMRPQWSFNDRYVLTSLTSAESVDRTLADLAGGSVMRLADHIANIQMCDWAPAEAMLACVRGIPGTGDKLRLTIVLLDVNGNILNDIPLPEDWDSASVNWSPDGRQLAVGYLQNSVEGTAVVSRTTETIRPVVGGGSAGWSPDGKWILTWGTGSDPGARSMISIVNAGSGESLPLAEGSDAVWQPSQAPAVPQVGSVPTEPLNIILFTTPLPVPGIMVKDTRKGDVLLVHTREGDYEMGPVEKGAYAIGPNQKFLVYCSNSGYLYAARIGDPSWSVVGNIREFVIIRKGGTPRFTFLFFGDNPFTVQVGDLITGESKTFPLPRSITAEE